MQIPTPQFVQTPLCNEVIDFTILSKPTFLSVDPSNIVFSGGTIAEAIQYQLILTAKARTSLIEATVAFNVNAIDCTPKNLVVSQNPIRVPQLGKFEQKISVTFDPPAIECG